MSERATVMLPQRQALQEQRTPLKYPQACFRERRLGFGRVTQRGDDLEQFLYAYLLGHALEHSRNGRLGHADALGNLRLRQFGIIDQFPNCENEFSLQCAQLFTFVRAAVTHVRRNVEV